MENMYINSIWVEPIGETDGHGCILVAIVSDKNGGKEVFMLLDGDGEIVPPGHVGLPHCFDSYSRSQVNEILDSMQDFLDSMPETDREKLCNDCAATLSA